MSGVSRGARGPSPRHLRWPLAEASSPERLLQSAHSTRTRADHVLYCRPARAPARPRPAQPAPPRRRHRGAAGSEAVPRRRRGARRAARRQPGRPRRSRRRRLYRAGRCPRVRSGRPRDRPLPVRHGQAGRRRPHVGPGESQDRVVRPSWRTPRREPGHDVAGPRPPRFFRQRDGRQPVRRRLGNAARSPRRRGRPPGRARPGTARRQLRGRRYPHPEGGPLRGPARLRDRAGYTPAARARPAPPRHDQRRPPAARAPATASRGQVAHMPESRPRRRRPGRHTSRPRAGGRVFGRPRRPRGRVRSRPALGDAVPRATRTDWRGGRAARRGGRVGRRRDERRRPGRYRRPTGSASAPPEPRATRCCAESSRPR